MGDKAREHRSRWRRPLIWALAALGVLVIAAGGTLAYAYSQMSGVSAAQEQVVAQLGPPPRFMVAYVPRTSGSSQELVRTEVWYYPDHEQKISFVEGAIASVETMPPDPEDATYPDLRPELFDFEMGYEEVAALLGGDVQEVEELPNLSAKDGLRLYASENGMFAIEKGKLVYVQTVGLGRALSALSDAEEGDAGTGTASAGADSGGGAGAGTQAGQAASGQAASGVPTSGEDDWLYPVFVGNAWGYVNKTGKVVVQPRFQSAEPMSEGLAVVSDAQGRYGYIDATGKVVIQPQFQMAGAFHEGLAWAGSNERSGYIDTAGKWVIQPRFVMAGDFGEGLAPISDENGMWGYVDAKGAWALQPKYSAADTFSEGRAAVQVGDDYVYIDKTGRTVIDAKLTSADVFREGLAPASTGDRMGFIDSRGSFVIPQKFLNAYAFSEGLAGVATDEGAGFVDKTGAWVIKPAYEDVGPFTGGIAAVWKDGKVGYVDTTGEWVYKPGGSP